MGFSWSPGTAGSLRGQQKAEVEEDEGDDQEDEEEEDSSASEGEWFPG